MTFPPLNLVDRQVSSVGEDPFKVVEILNVFDDPGAIIEAASNCRFDHINQHYPGVRAPVADGLLSHLCGAVSDIAAREMGGQTNQFLGQAWYSIVTRDPGTLTPIQRLPHFDGFDETQLAVMIYLNETPHGGTAFYRHLSTGLERVREADYPAYSASLEKDVRKFGLPEARYISDGAPMFERIFVSRAAFNSMIIYPGNALHSGVIDNQAALSPDPKKGRLTINGFFQTAPGGPAEQRSTGTGVSSDD